MKQAWEPVHTVDDDLVTARDRGWRPSACIADFDGRPHYCRLLNLDCGRWGPPEGDRYELTPVPPEAVRWAEEVIAIRRRHHFAWDADSRQLLDPGADTAPQDSDEARVLAQDRVRYDELLDGSPPNWPPTSTDRSWPAASSGRG